MPQKYDVHMYAVVRIKLESIEAESQLAAIAKAEEKRCDIDHLLRSGEFAKEIQCYLVDETGDEEYNNSRYYTGDADPESPRPMGNSALKWAGLE
jgi:hypothetical protein